MALLPLLLLFLRQIFFRCYGRSKARPRSCHGRNRSFFEMVIRRHRFAYLGFGAIIVWTVFTYYLAVYRPPVQPYKPAVSTYFWFHPFTGCFLYSFVFPGPD